MEDDDTLMGDCVNAPLCNMHPIQEMCHPMRIHWNKSHSRDTEVFGRTAELNIIISFSISLQLPVEHTVITGITEYRNNLKIKMISVYFACYHVNMTGGA